MAGLIVLCGCSGPKRLDPAVGLRPAEKIAETSAALTPENFDKIPRGSTSQAIDALLGKGRDAPSPPAFYKQAAASEIESEFGVKRWREWWSSSTGVTITVGFDSADKALVKQLDDGVKVRFVGWIEGKETVRTAE
jgi:hypothetical protein